MSARSLNKVTLIGNLTRDPELRYTPSGTVVCTFTVATNRDWVDQSGQKQESTEFTRAVAWSKLAEICSQLLRKGRKVYVEGRLQTRDWTTQEGQQRQTTEVVINEMIALGAPTGSVNETMETVGYDGGPMSPEDEVFVPEDVVAAVSDVQTDQKGAGADNNDIDDEGKASNSKKKKNDSDGDKKTVEADNDAESDESVSDDEIPF
jgi:single-strand DNA-binding protein